LILNGSIYEFACGLGRNFVGVEMVLMMVSVDKINKKEMGVCCFWRDREREREKGGGLC
jgi:hypothetical protein